jgi:hypothetical protein
MPDLIGITKSWSNPRPYRDEAQSECFLVTAVHFLRQGGLTASELECQIWRDYARFKSVPQNVRFLPLVRPLKYSAFPSCHRSSMNAGSYAMAQSTSDRRVTQYWFTSGGPWAVAGQAAASCRCRCELLYVRRSCRSVASSSGYAPR